jgi:release factor glutamine methyltransferase
MPSLQSTLQQCGLPLLEARCLLLYSLNQHRVTHLPPLSTAYLIAHQDDELSLEVATAFQQLVKRRRDDEEPLAYIIGEREFWGRPFFCREGTLIPRPDTETLCEVALNTAHYLPAGAYALDMGCGSGILGITLACEYPHLRVVMLDQSDIALAVTRENAARHGVLDRLIILQSNWFDALTHDLPNTRFHLILSNPPYIAPHDPHLSQGDLRFEPSRALVAENEGFSDLFHLIEHAPSYLVNNGWLWLEHGYNQSIRCKKKFSNLYWNKAEHRHDLAGWTRVTGAQLL